MGSSKSQRGTENWTELWAEKEPQATNKEKTLAPAQILHWNQERTDSLSADLIGHDGKGRRSLCVNPGILRSTKAMEGFGNKNEN